MEDFQNKIDDLWGWDEDHDAKDYFYRIVTINTTYLSQPDTCITDIIGDQLEVVDLVTDSNDLTKLTHPVFKIMDIISIEWTNKS